MKKKSKRGVDTPKKKKRNPVKIRMSKADKEWAHLVKERDEYVCQVCSRRLTDRAMAAHHIEGRRHKSTRLLLENGITLCSFCHKFNSEFSAHASPKDFKTWFQEKFPERWTVIQERVKQTMSERDATEEFFDKVRL